MNTFAEELHSASDLHHHLCPRQVLGIRMGRYAGVLLELSLPQKDKRLLTFIETDGCFADGVSVATGCWLGRRTMRLVDYGKVAATFVDTQTAEAIRIIPHYASRKRALIYSPDSRSRWHAQLHAYQEMPDEELLVARTVKLSVNLQTVISHPGKRVTCQMCKEEIINEREVILQNKTLCRSCADGAYYH